MIDIISSVAVVFFLWIYVSTFCTSSGRRKLALLMFPPKPGRQFTKTPEQTNLKLQGKEGGDDAKS